MSHMLTLRIHRAHGWADFTVTVPDDAYVLDALEAAERQDSTLLFQHACHHASCGSCGLRVNGRERLACVTRVAEVARRGRAVKLEPLRNLPLLGDLLVDHQTLFSRIDEIDLPPIRAAETGDVILSREPAKNPQPMRFENCIECGLCVSACPVAGSDLSYWGPAALAAAARVVAEPRGRGPLSAALRARLGDPLLSVSYQVRLGVALGIVFLMTVKPDLLGSLITIGVALIVGLAMAVPAWRRGRSDAAVVAK